MAYFRRLTRALKWIPGAVLVAILAVAAMAFGCGGPLRTIVLVQVSGLVLHPPSDRDQFFQVVAVNFKQSALCDRIDWRADGGRGGWDTPYEFRTMRSACRSYLEHPDATSSVVPSSMPQFAAQVRALGYSDADVTQAAFAETSYATDFYPFYRSLLADQTFRSRLREAPGHSEPRDRSRLRPATAIEFVFQMVAVEAPEAALCSKISPNATFVEEGGGTALLQSQCYLHIAFNSRDASLCEPLPAAGSFPHVNQVYDSRERCRETVAVYSRPNFNSAVTYEPTLLPRATDFPAVLREIEYEAQTLPTLSEATAEEYWKFVERLVHRGPPSERAEFLRRVAGY